MKHIFLFSFLLLFPSCAPHNIVSIDTNQIIPFRSSDKIIGYGVRIGESILTVNHVYQECQKFSCHIDGGIMKNIDTSSSTDALWISQSGKQKTNLFLPKVGEEVVIIHPGKNGFEKSFTQVTAIDMNYVGYDASLEMKSFTGAIEITADYESGESGLPVWTRDGQLIGVVSATDRSKHRSYIVR